MPNYAPPLLSLRGIGKNFAGVRALDGVDLVLQRGKIHALLGENGAGKSTLIKVLTGQHQPSFGHIEISGNTHLLASPQEAMRWGITLVPQDVVMVPNLSIGRNMLLGAEGRGARRAQLSPAEHQAVSSALAKMGADFDPATPAARLSVPHLRLAQIARALLNPGAIMVLDEPTAALSEPDANHLLARLEALRDEGKAILYVTHRLSEVMRIADCGTVLRDGTVAGRFRRGEVDRATIVRMMAKDTGTADALAEPGRAMAPQGHAVRQGGSSLEVTGLSRPGVFEDVSFTARAGCVVGIAGVQGSGHGYLLRAIAGIDKPTQGNVVLDGARLRPGGIGPAFNAGLMLVPADRRRASIIPMLSLRENLAISRRLRPGARAWGLRWPRRERAAMQDYIAALAIRPAMPEAQIATLSGGNQQKAVLARALESAPKALLIEEPTQGVDVAAKAEIHKLLRRAAQKQGVIVVIASSEFEELIGLADEIHVMRSGRLTAALDGARATYTEILQNALP